MIALVICWRSPACCVSSKQMRGQVVSPSPRFPDGKAQGKCRKGNPQTSINNCPFQGSLLKLAPPKNPPWVFTNFTNSRRHCDPVTRQPQRFEGLTNWRWDCFNQVEELPGGGDTVYVYHLRFRGVRGPDIHPKHSPVRALHRASHNRMGN